MLHACAARFDVTENLKNCTNFWELNKAQLSTPCTFSTRAQAKVVLSNVEWVNHAMSALTVT